MKGVLKIHCVYPETMGIVCAGCKLLCIFIKICSLWLYSNLPFFSSSGCLFRISNKGVFKLLLCLWVCQFLFIVSSVGISTLCG